MKQEGKSETHAEQTRESFCSILRSTGQTTPLIQFIFVRELYRSYRRLRPTNDNDVSGTENSARTQETHVFLDDHGDVYADLPQMHLRPNRAEVPRARAHDR